MSDRKLLELAAKAAGIDLIGPVEKFIVQLDERQKGGFIVANAQGGHSPWNPLTDDGDALRLAVVLDLDVEIDIQNSGWVHVSTMNHIDQDGLPLVDLVYGCPDGMDPYAATRRAIVCAAAEIATGAQS